VLSFQKKHETWLISDMSDGRNGQGCDKMTIVSCQTARHSW
jgi:hypothetical protein